MPNTCFISGEEGPLTEVLIDGKVYFISEKLTDEHPIKIIKQMVIGKIESGKNQQKELITKIEDMAKSMNVSKEELIKMLGGGNSKIVQEDDESKPIVAKQTQQSNQDDGFKPVEGNLKSTSRASLKMEDGASDYVTPAVPAYSSVHAKDGQTVVETNKKIKTDNNVMLSKSDMGTTAIAIVQNDSDNITKIITEVNREKNLVRGGATGNGFGNSAKTCPLCKGTGITSINNKVCAKCNGSGFIFL